MHAWTTIRAPAPTPGGFSLIALLSVMAIIGILSALALPNYQEHVRHGARAEARVGLLAAAHWLERAAILSGAYPPLLPDGLRTVASRRYVIDLRQDRQDGGYTLLATPQDAQAHDRCGSFTLTHTGVRGNTGLTRGATSTDCWNR